MTTREVIIISKKTRDKKWLRLMLLGQLTREGMLELYPSATSANITAQDLVPLHVGTTRGPKIKPKIVGPLPW